MTVLDEFYLFKKKQTDKSDLMSNFLTACQLSQIYYHHPKKEN